MGIWQIVFESGDWSGNWLMKKESMINLTEKMLPNPLGIIYNQKINISTQLAAKKK